MTSNLVGVMLGVVVLFALDEGSGIMVATVYLK